MNEYCRDLDDIGRRFVDADGGHMLNRNVPVRFVVDDDRKMSLAEAHVHVLRRSIASKTSDPPQPLEPDTLRASAIVLKDEKDNQPLRRLIQEMPSAATSRYSDQDRILMRMHYEEYDFPSMRFDARRVLLDELLVSALSSRPKEQM